MHVLVFCLKRCGLGQKRVGDGDREGVGKRRRVQRKSYRLRDTTNKNKRGMNDESEG